MQSSVTFLAFLPSNLGAAFFCLRPVQHVPLLCKGCLLVLGWRLELELSVFDIQRRRLATVKAC